MFRLRDVVCFCALICISIDAAKILAVFPTPSISHQAVFRSLTNELVGRGHEVVVITTDHVYSKGEAPTNLTEIDVHDLSYKIWKRIMSIVINSDKNEALNEIPKQLLEMFEKQTSLPEVRDIIENKNNTFDLLLVESWTRFAIGFSHAVKAPVISFSSHGAVFDNYNVIGAPTHPILYPTSFNNRIYNLTLWEKVTQYYNNAVSMYHYYEQEANENACIRRIFGEDAPALSVLQNNIDMMFVNINPIWEGNYPVPPGVIHIFGMHQKQQKELPQDLKEYLDSSVYGVIYMSFGTNIETTMIPLDKIQAIVNAFSKLPYDVLWKWNEDELPGQTKNIKISKWLPQSDLLRHPKVKLFITQGGLQSTDETITAGVPVIGIPMMGDQWYNVEKYEFHKIGKKVNLADIEEETFRRDIKTVIEDKSYRENVVRLRTLMNDQPMSSLERAVWWTEHVLRHGGARHLRAPAANMSWSEYYELPLVLTLLSIAISVVAVSVLILCKIVKLILQYMASKNVKIKSS